jgi:hypothetical protein
MSEAHGNPQPSHRFAPVDHVEAHFRECGALAFRLAHAMLGSPERAARTVRDVFAELPDDPTRLAWPRTLAAVRARCSEAPARPERAVEPSTHVHPDAPFLDELPVPAEVVAFAFTSLSESDRDALWAALLDSRTSPFTAEETDSLAEALRRLDEAIADQSIPDDGGVGWPD